MKSLVQYLIPQHLLSRCIAKLANCRIRLIKNLFIDLYIKFYRVNMQEALEPDPHKYFNFNNFFTRALKPEVRPISQEPNSIVSPIDGAISQFGKIENDSLIQAKGFSFALHQLLDDEILASKLHNGNFITLYLSPRDYHRIHMPYAGDLQKMTYVPGSLFAVNSMATRHIPNLFARNERVINVFNTKFGCMVMVLVGALIVASIETTWAGPITPNRKKKIISWDYAQQNVSLQRSTEMGRFKMGSTVILLFPEKSIQFTEALTINQPIKMGQLLGYIL